MLLGGSARNIVGDGPWHIVMKVGGAAAIATYTVLPLVANAVSAERSHGKGRGKVEGKGRGKVEGKGGELTDHRIS